MIKKLLHEAFEKMIEKEPHAGFTRKAILLSEEIEEWLHTNGYQESITDKTLRNYYHKADKGQSVTIRSHILNALAEVIGYENYEMYCKKHTLIEVVSTEQNLEEEKEKRSTIPPNKKKMLRIGGIFVLVVMGWLIYSMSHEEQRWMQWSEDHYEEVDFTKKAYAAGMLVLYNKEILENFHKINPNCETQFFNLQKQPVIFYGKNNEKKYEYFTTSGNHPLTRKHLRPITEYMIKKYICP